jgi:hypothetical protein
MNDSFALLETIKAEIKADIEHREASAAQRDFQVPGNVVPWRVGVTQFILTWQESEFGNDIMLMMNRGNGWIGWGGPPDYRAVIAESVTTEMIESHGTMLQFFQWVITEAVRRANVVAGISFPDPADKPGRARFVIENQITVVNNRPTLPPPPLGIAPV